MAKQMVKIKIRNAYYFEIYYFKIIGLHKILNFG